MERLKFFGIFPLRWWVTRELGAQLSSNLPVFKLVGSS